jgi:hypothetical protein
MLVVSSVKFMSDSVNTIAIGGEDSSIKLYDLRAIGKVVNTMRNLDLRACNH